MKFNSYLTVFCIIVVMISVSVFFFIYEPSEPREQPVFASFSMESFSTLPLISASMCGHFATPYVYKELKDRSVQKMTKVITI